MIQLFRQMQSKDCWMMLICVLLVSGQVCFDLTLSDYTKEITTLIGMESDVLSDYLTAGGKILTCALGSALFAVIVGYFAANEATLSTRIWFVKNAVKTFPFRFSLFRFWENIIK